MYLNIESIDNAESIIDKHTPVKQNENSTFESIVERDRKEIKNNKIEKEDIKSDKELEQERMDKINKIINSSAADHIDKIAKTDICSGNDKYFEKDGTLNVRDIIIRLGNDISYKDLQQFQGEITDLWKEGLINDDNYFEGMGWIQQKVLSSAIKIVIKNKEDNVLDRLTENRLDK